MSVITEEKLYKKNEFNNTNLLRLPNLVVIMVLVYLESVKNKFTRKSALKEMKILLGSRGEFSLEAILV